MKVYLLKNGLIHRLKITLFLFLYVLTSDVAGFAQQSVKLPSADLIWTVAEYSKLTEVITSNHALLPIYTEPSGKILLNRITAKENLDFGTNLTMPFNQRMESFLGIQEEVNKILKTYIAAVNQDKKNLHQEVAAIMAYSLSIAALGILLS